MTKKQKSLLLQAIQALIDDIKWGTDKEIEELKVIKNELLTQ